MAESPAHKFGQVIGSLLEAVVLPQLEDFCQTQGLYLDHQKKSRPARAGRKVSWQDPFGNIHDLDFVIERNASDNRLGSPVAFIEVAWRRYTKHSRNKAQEIQGAILPLAVKYQWNNPFLGAILGGEFTRGSINQLESNGFQILHFPYESIVAAFASEGIDIRFNEATPDISFKERVDAYIKLGAEGQSRIRDYLVRSNQQEMDQFFVALHTRLGRAVMRVVIIPTYGREFEFATIVDAIEYLDQHSIYEGSGEFRKYEMLVEFTNRDKVEASIHSKEKAKEFLLFILGQ